VTDRPPPSEPLPRRFGPYVLFDRIGEGGMARLYLAREVKAFGAGRLCVVKQILPILASSKEFSRLLIEEAKLAAALEHGNVAKVLDLGREGETLYIAMEYVEGFDLSELLKRCSKSKIPLPIEFGLFIVLQTLRALDYAHRKKDERGRALSIVHRDVSPSNVLVSFDGEVKLCDFGIARAMGADPALPAEAIQGKAGYMSPEAASGQSVDARSDVFAAGVILWELTAGRRLYRGEGGRPPAIEQARRAEIPDLPQRGLPSEAELFGIVRHALEKEPAARYATARDFLRELEAYAAGAGLVASPLRFGEWLTDNFGAEIVERRAQREQAAERVVESAQDSDSLTGLAAPTPYPLDVTPDPAPVVEPEPASLMAVAHSQREPSLPPEAGQKSRGWVLWVIIAVVLLAIAAGVALR
jgi:eukaryotic-like serine/threonine-protein kinase